MCTLAPDFLFRPSQLLLMMHLLLHFLSQHHTNLFCVSAYLCSGNLFLGNVPLSLKPSPETVSHNSVSFSSQSVAVTAHTVGKSMKWWLCNPIFDKETAMIILILVINIVAHITRHGKNHWVWVVFWDWGKRDCFGLLVNGIRCAGHTGIVILDTKICEWFERECDFVKSTYWRIFAPVMRQSNTPKI